MTPTSDHCYQAIGGMEMCRKLSEVFYGHVAQDPILRPIFRGSFHCAIPAFALYLAQFLGGPCEYSQGRWWLSLREAHLRFKIGEKERKAWLKNMRLALRDVQIEPSAANALYDFFEQSSAGLINHPTPGEWLDHPLSKSISNGFQHQLDRCSTSQQTIEAAVAAVRTGDAERAIELAGSPSVRSYFERNRADLASLLAVMITNRHPTLIEYVQQMLMADPDLVHQCYSLGRTLLHDSAAAGNTAMIRFLLRLGANPNGVTGHPPLYCVGNECSTETGAAVVRLLVDAGADVNAQEGVKQCTALHMAARRGNVQVAEALLDCGANIEARDSSGDSPLRRAVNCAKPEVAALLLARGANPNAKGSKGLTPRQAARSARMKQLLES